MKLRASMMGVVSVYALVEITAVTNKSKYTRSFKHQRPRCVTGPLVQTMQ